MNSQINQISQLSNFVDSNGLCSIKARVSKKSGVKSYGTEIKGKMFSVELFDGTGNIRAVGFGKDVDRLFPLLQENHVYLIKNGRVENANKQHTSRDYEIILNQLTAIEGCTDIAEIPNHPHLHSLKDLFSMNTNELIDTIGVIMKIGAIEEKKIRGSQDNKIQLKDIIVTDTTGVIVTITLWETEATAFNASEGDVLGILNGKICEYNNAKKINTSETTKVIINPDWQEIINLKNYWNFTASRQHTQSQNLFEGSSVSVELLYPSENSQSMITKNERERILQKNKYEQEYISKRYLELDNQQEAINQERNELHFKKRRLFLERKNIMGD